MLKDEIPLCDYCGKPLLWNDNALYEYVDPVTGIDMTLYCSKECLMKDKELSEEEYNKGILSVSVNDKVKEKKHE